MPRPLPSACRHYGIKDSLVYNSCRRFPNLVAGLEVSRPDQVWAADITYI